MPTYSDNISIEMLERIWALLSATIDEKNDLADAKLEAATAKAAGVDVTLDKAGSQAAISALTGIAIPAHPAVGTLGGAAVLPVPAAIGAAPAVVGINAPSLGNIAPLGDYGPPPVFDDSNEFTFDSLRSLYENDRMEMLAALKASFTEFMDEYFPPGQYFEKATDWLERALDAQGTGIPIVVENAMWERDRARLTAEATRAEDETLTTWAGRGYQLPPGALVHGMNTVRAGLTNALSAQSRDIAIKVTDVHIENARFAVGQAASIRSQAMSAAVEYVKALMVSPQYVGQWLGALIDGRAKLVGAQADVFKTRAGVATDVYKVGAQTQLETFKTTADVSIESARAQNTTGLEVYRVGADVSRQQFLAQLEGFSKSESLRLDQFRITQETMARYFEAEIRASSLKGELLTKAGELSARVGDIEMQGKIATAKLQVDAAMEAAKMVATQAAAALNNLQLSASASNSSSTNGRM